MDTVSISFPSEEYLETIDDAAGQAGCVNRSEFIRQAVRYKFEEMDVDVDLPEP